MSFWKRNASAIGVAGLSLVLAACTSSKADSHTQETTAVSSPEKRFPVKLTRPTNFGGLDVTQREISGAPASIACQTCHQPGSTNALAARPGAPKDLHRDISLSHGDLSCQSCHQAANPGQLHGSDGRSFRLEDSMAHCSQCHGPQRRNYNHGAHGGMRGYWDLSRGARERNDCISCHPPHQPKYPQVTPMPGPKDRFARPRQHSGSLIERRYQWGADHE